MFRLTRSGSLALTVLALSTAVIVAKERPHKFRGAGQLNFATLQVVGSGIATHLGDYRERAAITVFVPLPGGQPWEFFISGWSIFTGDEGDELHETFSGVLNMATGAATATVTYVPEGTGRFANATGTATLQLQMDLSNGTFRYTGEGVIDY
jgi:hypothetical protein